MFLFMLEVLRSCRQAVYAQSKTCAKPPVYAYRTALTGFCGDISSIQAEQGRLSMTTAPTKASRRWTMPSCELQNPALTVRRLILALLGSRSTAHLPVTVYSSGLKMYLRTGICQGLCEASQMEVSWVIHSKVCRVTEFHSWACCFVAASV